MSKSISGVLTLAQLTGRDQAHLQPTGCGKLMQADAALALECLQKDAAAAGFELAVASSFRSFERQCAIWNGKAAGVRPVYDDAGQAIEVDTLSARELLHAILRFSALPGTSRHHWGTDVDVFDRAAVGQDYSVQLSPQEVAAGGVFDPLHCWLDARMAAGESHGFFRPYAKDRGGVAVERWHLSYAPVSQACAGVLNAELLRECWAACEEKLLLSDEIEAELAEILARYVEIEPRWCPAVYGTDTSG